MSVPGPARHLLFVVVLLGCDDAGESPATGADGLFVPTPGDAAADAEPIDAGARFDEGAPPDGAFDAGRAVDAARLPDAVLEPDAAPDETPDAEPDAGPPPVDPPARVLFIGNSFTFGGPVSDIFDALANDAGWPDPEVHLSAFGGETLNGHRVRRAQTLALVDEGEWDVVVLQEQSTRPTDNAGDPARFKADVTWFHDRLRERSPAVRVVLYETWARHPDHDIYPDTFPNAAEMQAQLRFHYHDAAEHHVPRHAAAPVEPPPVVAPAGSAWARHLAEADPLRLHADDDWHAARTGQYLNALAIYATVYRRAVDGRTPWRLDAGAAARLQATVDELTGFDVGGGPDGPPPLGLQPGERIRVDFGGEALDGWTTLTDAVDGAALNLPTVAGARSSVDLQVTRPFGGVNDQGLGDNALGYPPEASADSFFCGSFDDHADGLNRPGQLTLRGLEPGADYVLALFASRRGDDGGAGRLTRYAAGGASADLEVSDNADRVARLEVSAGAAGELVLDVAVSPEGAGRFCYLGVLELSR